MDIDAEDDEKTQEQNRLQHKLPPKLDEWSVHFHIGSKHEVNVVINYHEERSKSEMEVDGAATENVNAQSAQIDSIYASKVNAVFGMTKSVPITLSYVCKLFDGRYLQQKFKKSHSNDSKQQSDPTNDDMIDID